MFMKNMMRKIYITLMIGLVSMTIYSQNYIKKIAKSACDCITNIPEEKNVDEFDLGICLLEEAVLYKEQILRDYGINIENIDTEGEKLGRVIGVEMIALCPDQLKRMAIISGEGNTDSDVQTAEGTITKIENGNFIVFSLTNEEGKSSSFYWLTYVKSNYDLQNNYTQLKNKRVIIKYLSEELFDYRINEYGSFKVIKSIDIIE